ncbi:MAG: hypothetical protein R2854_23360 [Caldilineaceae bacterium]
MPAASAFNAADMNYDVSVIPIPKRPCRASSERRRRLGHECAERQRDAAWTFLQWLQSTDGGQRIYTESAKFSRRSCPRPSPMLSWVWTYRRPIARPSLPKVRTGKVGRAGYFAEWNELSGSIISPALDTIWAGRR